MRIKNNDFAHLDCCFADAWKKADAKHFPASEKGGIKVDGFFRYNEGTQKLQRQAEPRRRRKSEMKQSWLGLEDRVVIVTGGASGIGKHVADTLTVAGAKTGYLNE